MLGETRRHKWLYCRSGVLVAVQETAAAPTQPKTGTWARPVGRNLRPFPTSISFRNADDDKGTEVLRRLKLPTTTALIIRQSIILFSFFFFNNCTSSYSVLYTNQAAIASLTRTSLNSREILVYFSTFAVTDFRDFVRGPQRSPGAQTFHVS